MSTELCDSGFQLQRHTKRRGINGSFETCFTPIVLLSENSACDFTVKYEVCG